MAWRIGTKRMAATVAFGLALVAGCGRGAYEAKLEQTVGGLQSGSDFRLLGQPTPVPGSGLQVRFPRSMNESLTPGSGDPKRVQPPGVNIPGLKLTREGYVEDAEGGKLSYYCYIAVLDSGGADTELKLLRGSVSRGGGQVGDWSPVECSTPDGRVVAWKRLTSSGPQQFFYITPSGEETFVEQEGWLEVFTRQQEGQQLIVAWRMPAAIKPHTQVDKLAPMVAGSVTGG